MDDLISNISQLDKLSDDQLKQYANNPNSPLGIYALSILQNRAIMRNQSQAAGAQQPQPTVRDSITASLPENTGIAAALGDKPVFTAAEGGIVAFGDGGGVKGYSGKDGDSLVDSMSEIYRKLGAAGLDIAHWPVIAMDKADESRSLVNREIARLLGFKDKNLPQIVKGEGIGGDTSWTPFSNKYIDQKAPVSTPSMSKVDRKVGSDVANFAVSEQPSEMEKLLGTVPNIPKENAVLNKAIADAPVAKPTKGGERPSTSVISPTAPTAGLESLYTDIPFDPTEYDKYATPVKDLSAYAKEYSDILGEDKGLAALKAKSDQMGANIEKQKELAPWMAAMRFGLGMAAGKSPFALQNLAEGGIEGMKDYANSIADYNKAQERKFDIDARLASAERSERVNALKYGQDSRQADQANQRAIGLAKLSDKANFDLKNAANKLQAKEFVIEDQRKREELKLTEQHYKDWYNVSKDKAAKDLAALDKTIRNNETAQLKTLMSEAGDRLDKLMSMGVDATDPLYQSSLQIYNGAAEALGLRTGVKTTQPAGPRAKPLSAFGK